VGDWGGAGFPKPRRLLDLERSKGMVPASSRENGSGRCSKLSEGASPGGWTLAETQALAAVEAPHRAVVGVVVVAVEDRPDDQGVPEAREVGVADPRGSLPLGVVETGAGPRWAEWEARHPG